MKKYSYILVLIALMLGCIACGKRTHVLDYGYYRIDLPEQSYHEYAQDLPYSFDLSDYAQVVPVLDEPYWMNIVYPQWNATIHCSYKSLKKCDLSTVMEETRTLVYKHTIRADAIAEDYFENHEHHTSGVLYEIEGNAASSVQFFVTDSVQNYVRGSLYFNNLPNADSIAPVNAFIREDIRHMMETIVWK